MVTLWSVRWSESLLVLFSHKTIRLFRLPASSKIVEMRLNPVPFTTDPFPFLDEDC